MRKPTAYVEPIPHIMTHRVMVQDHIPGLNTTPRIYEEFPTPELAVEALENLVKKGLVEKESNDAA